jgi:hypothetical protein
VPGPADRYVRLYCHDSPEWAALGFAGRSVVTLLLPALDTEGAVYLGTTEPWRLAVDLLDAPEPLARQGMDRALSLGFIEHREHYLVVRGFAAAQKSAASEALRKRESRRRQRDKAIRVTERDMSQNVTSQNVTPTNGYHAILAENEEMSRSHAGRVRDIVRDIVRADAPKTAGHESPYEDDPNPVKLPGPEPWKQLWKTWEQVAFRGLPSGDPFGHRARLLGLWDACNARDPHDPVSVFKKAAEAYCEAQKKRGKAPRLPWFANDFGEYADAHKGNGKRTSPEIEELEATQALHDRAVQAGDGEAVTRLGLELRRIGKRMAGHV